jgi:hypothetical protein
VTDDFYGIPPTIFGGIDPELPAMIGRIAMLGATLENKLSNLLDVLTGSPQDAHAYLGPSANIRELGRLLRAYGGTFSEDRFVERTGQLLSDSKPALTERNDVVHRLWPRAAIGNWGGWKPRRGRPRVGESSTEWRDYTRDELLTQIAKLCELIGLAGEIIGESGGLVKHPELDRLLRKPV